jgi:methyltransferase (TIGR00027 family)
MHRAAHQLLDDPKVFDDPLALRILGIDEPLPSRPNPRPDWLENSPLSRILRASLVVRSRYAEDQLHLAVQRGVGQYVVLGAGLDTFACRNPYPADILHVFEVDHPATQSWKRARLEGSAIPIPPTLTFVPIDFESESLADGLRRAGFDTNRSAFFSWLGVTPYLQTEAITATLKFAASLPPGSAIVFDYMLAPSLLNLAQRLALRALSRRVARAGEPFRSSFDPAALQNDLRAMGFRQIEDLTPEALNGRYLQGRKDKLRVGTLAHIIHARV